jgi:hypothetical protein
VDDDRDLVELETENARGFRVVNLRDVADLEEVIARAERAELFASALPRAVRDFRGTGAGDAAVLLDVREVGLAAVAVLDLIRPNFEVRQLCLPIDRG